MYRSFVFICLFGFLVRFSVGVCAVIVEINFAFCKVLYLFCLFVAFVFNGSLFVC